MVVIADMQQKATAMKTQLLIAAAALAFVTAGAVAPAAAGKLPAGGLERLAGAQTLKEGTRNIERRAHLVKKVPHVQRPGGKRGR